MLKHYPIINDHEIIENILELHLSDNIFEAENFIKEYFDSPTGIILLSKAVLEEENLKHINKVKILI